MPRAGIWAMVVFMQLMNLGYTWAMAYSMKSTLPSFFSSIPWRLSPATMALVGCLRFAGHVD